MLAYGPALDAVRARLREDRSSLVRASAAETLGDLGDAAAVAELVTALDDQDAAVRGFAANALGLVGSPDLLPMLERRIAVEPEATVRAELCGSRYRLGAREALPPLLALFDEMDSDVGSNVLELWDDLTRRCQPPTLESDAPAIIEALTRVMARLPLLEPHARVIVARLGSR